MIAFSRPSEPASQLGLTFSHKIHADVWPGRRWTMVKLWRLRDLAGLRVEPYVMTTAVAQVHPRDQFSRPIGRLVALRHLNQILADWGWTRADRAALWDAIRASGTTLKGATP